MPNEQNGKQRDRETEQYYEMEKRRGEELIWRLKRNYKCSALCNCAPQMTSDLKMHINFHIIFLSFNLLFVSKGFPVFLIV